MLAVLLAAILCPSVLVAQPELNKEQEKLIRQEVAEKIAAQEITGEFPPQNSVEIEGVQALPRSKSTLSKENLQKGLVIAMLKCEGKKAPLLVFAASLSPSLRQKTGVGDAVAFLEPPGKVVGIKPATVSKLEEKVKQPKITLKKKEDGGRYAATLILRDGNLKLKCSIPCG